MLRACSLEVLRGVVVDLSFWKVPWRQWDVLTRQGWELEESGGGWLWWELVTRFRVCQRWGASLESPQHCGIAWNSRNSQYELGVEVSQDQQVRSAKRTRD